MNKLIIALSVACASACVFADVGATPSKFTTNTWFSAKVENAGAVTNGCTVTSATKPTIAEGKYVIDSELESPVTFTAATKAPGEDMTEVSFTLDTSIVPADARQNLSTKGKVAFAASEASGDAKAYFAWLGVAENNGWVQLTGPAVKEDNASYKLDVTFDNRDGGKKVQFKVDGTALTTNGVDWLNYASPVSASALAIDLVGSGSITSIYGNQLTITAEVVPVDGGKIEIKEEDMAAFKNSMPAKYTTVDEFIAADASEAFGSFATSDIKVGTAYALGLVVKNDDGEMVPKDGGQLIAKALAETPDANGIKLGVNVTPPQGTGATITYQVVDESNAATEGLVIPSSKLSAGLKKFTVKAIVTPAAE